MTNVKINLLRILVVIVLFLEIIITIITYPFMFLIFFIQKLVKYLRNNIDNLKDVRYN